MKTRQNKLRKPRSQKEALPEYGFGGWWDEKGPGSWGQKKTEDTSKFRQWLSGGADGGPSAGGTVNKIFNIGSYGLDMVMPGTGALMRGVQKKNMDREATESNANSLLDQNRAAMQANAGGSINNFTDMWSAKNGGVVPGGKPNVSLEKNEVTMGPDGSMKKFNLPPHPNSSRVPLEEDTVIFSDNDKLRMPDGKTPAEAADELKKKKNPAQKALDNTNTSALARKSAERNIRNIDQKLGEIFEFQLMKTAELGESNLTNSDGTVASTFGDFITKAGDFLGSNKGKNMLQTAGSLAPIAYNMFQGGQKVEQLNPAAFQNPLAYGALETMRNRQPNMNPALQATDAAVAAGRANLRSTATGRGQYAAGSIALENVGMGQRANIYAQGQQQRNQYLGEYGQMQAGVGQKMADTNLLVSDLNARNQAAGRAYGAAAAGQLGQWSQIQQQMAGQRSRDEMLMEQFKSWNSMLQTQDVGQQNVYGQSDANVGFNMSGVKAKYKMKNYKGI